MIGIVKFIVGCLLLIASGALFVHIYFVPLFRIESLKSKKMIDSPVEEKVVLDAHVLNLIDRVVAKHDGIRKYGSDYSVEFGYLVDLGDQATSTIIHEIKDSIDLKKINLLKTVLRRMRTAAGNRFLQTFDKPNWQLSYEQEIEKIYEFGDSKHIPRLKELQLIDGLDKALFLEIQRVLLVLGDMSVFEEYFPFSELSALGKEDALLVFSDFEPLEKALGLRSSFELTHRLVGGEDQQDLLFMAIDEWYYENILKKPSPFKPSASFNFSEPYADAKNSAWNDLLLESKQQRFGNGCIKYIVPLEFRVFPSEQSFVKEDLLKDFYMMFAVRDQLHIYVFKPTSIQVAVDYFTVDAIKQNTMGAYEDVSFVYRSSVMKADTYAEMMAQMHSICNARINNWWSNNVYHRYSSAGQLIISFSEFSDPKGLRSGYYGSIDSKYRKDHIKLLTAKQVLKKFVWNQNFVKGVVDKKAFSEFFLATAEQWGHEERWWLQRRMLILASSFCDSSVLPFLEKYLEPNFLQRDGFSKDAIAYAKNAIKEISKKE